MDGLLRVISGPWTTYILWRLGNYGEVRFGELKRLVPGISSRVLTERLRNLEQAGLIYRNHKPTIPPQVSYGLTQNGLAFKDILNDMNDLAVRIGISGNCEHDADEHPSQQAV
ncbi:winged helix-turn-helix transcriptional regulator [Yoonia sp. R2331]|uniref:winged helix-turn-helix transcriptional regulator n=1 Tax=Yoonia sp. R2331 TaxID=3237238 RepID=UPI0034E55DF5